MTMPKRSRIQRILKWTGVVVCVVILTMWLTSALRPTLFRTPFGGVAWYHGAVMFLEGATNDYGYLEESRLPPNLAGPPKWHETLGLSALPQSLRLFGKLMILMPLWLPFLGAAVPTAILWHRDRRTVEPGCCQRCGYNLTGNTSGICPECGEPCDAEVRAT